MVLLRNLRKYIPFFKVFLVIIFEVSISPLRCELKVGWEELRLLL